MSLNLFIYTSFKLQLCIWFTKSNSGIEFILMILDSVLMVEMFVCLCVRLISIITQIVFRNVFM